VKKMELSPSPYRSAVFDPELRPKGAHGRNPLPPGERVNILK